MSYPESLAPVAKEIDEVLNLENFHLVDAKVGTGSRVPLVKLLVDLEDRFITIDDCAGLSKRIGEILDRSGCFPRGYRLEVSSPGMSHHLRESWEFRKHLDRKLRIYYTEKEQMKEVEGHLLEIDSEGLVLKTAKSEINILFKNLDHAKSVIDWHRHPSKKVG
ncbi:hypothetical protein AMJ86_09020 [bacterium SM23_57]|nr:MAG: hypothetical protein AMJ86_09020 [bacterium SM23_57]